MANANLPRSVPRDGLGTFLLGVALAASGGYMLATRATVTTGFWNLWGYPSFGLSLVPFMMGFGLLFAGRTLLGTVLTVAGLSVILAGLLLNLHLYFRPTTLYEMLLMAGMLAAGLGLVSRSVYTFVRFGT